MSSRAAPWFPRRVLPLFLWLTLTPPQLVSAQPIDEATRWAQKEPMALLTLMQKRCQEADPVRAVVGCKAWADAMNASSDAVPIQVIELNARLRDVLLELGRYADAEAPARRALAVAEAQEDTRNVERVVSVQLDGLAFTLRRGGKLDDAEPLARRALAIMETALGKDHPEVAAGLNNLAELLRAQGKLDEAEPLYRRALAIWETALGKDHPEVAAGLNNLAGLLYARGKLDEAEPLVHRALTIWKIARGGDHPTVAMGLNGLAALLRARGKLDEAEPLARRALAIMETALGNDHPEVAMVLNDLAMLLEERGKLDDAESLCRRALAIWEIALGRDHPEVATGLNNLAGLQRVRGKLDDAELLYRRTLAILETALGKDHPNVATVLNNLAGLQRVRGRLDNAEPLYRRALAIWETSLGKDHPTVARGLNNFAFLALSQSHPERALSSFRRALDIREAVLRSSPTEEYTLGLLQTWQAEQAAVYGLLLVLGNNPHAVDLALRTALLNKSRTQDVGALVNQALRSRLKTDEQKAKFVRMEQLLAERARLLDRAGGEEKRKQEQQLLWEAQRLNQELSVQLGLSSSQAIPSLAGIREAVAATLPADAALVEVVLGETANWQARTQAERKASIQGHYIALALYRGGQVEAVDLGTVAEVHKVVMPLLNGLRNPREAIQGKAHDAYQVVFAKLDESLKRRGIRQLIISPELILQLLPWQALHDGKTYLVDRYAIRYVAAGRDLLRPASSAQSGPGMVLAAPLAPGQRPLVAARTVSILLGQRMGARLLVGPDATEANLAQAESPFTLLLAAHGKYRPAPPRQVQAVQGALLEGSALGLRPLGPMGARSLVPWQEPVPDLDNIEEAMHRSVLALTPGGNSQDPSQDGQLTAEEVLRLRLQGTQLVTMLACEGGMGALGLGQGVYGLRRAFLQAGAETVVSTLWSVDEQSAADLIDRYYDKLLVGKKSRVEALDEAMKELRSDKKHLEYSHPYYWAPFVVLGQDGPLRLPAGTARLAL